jgi:DDE family transposase
MATQCHNQLTLGFQPKIVLDFNGGEITSDSGLLLLRQFDAQLALTKKLKGLFNDWRNPLFIEHHTHEMVCQRIYQIAAGYQDCNDADTLRSDATFQTIVGKADPLASQPTLSRLENQADWETIGRLGAVGLQWFLQHGYRKRETPEEILLDSDASDDPCHGQQEFAFFHGKYGEHMYHPLFFFEAKTGCLLSALLRPGNASASAEIAAELTRLVPIVKRRFPKSQLSYRADAGSATPEIYRTLESFEMLYAIGIASNSVFKRRTERWLNKAKRKYARTKTPIRLFHSFRHRAGSWNNRRRIVVKMEVGPFGDQCPLCHHQPPG